MKQTFERGLKPHHRIREFMWICVVRWLLEGPFTKAWKEYPLIAYPLAIHFAFGGIKLYYIKHGFMQTFSMLMRYNEFPQSKTENFDDLYTKKEQFGRTLDKEMAELEEQYFDGNEPNINKDNEYENINEDEEKG